MVIESCNLRSSTVHQHLRLVQLVLAEQEASSRALAAPSAENCCRYRAALQPSPVGSMQVRACLLRLKQQPPSPLQWRPCDVEKAKPTASSKVAFSTMGFGRDDNDITDRRRRLGQPRRNAHRPAGERISQGGRRGTWVLCRGPSGTAALGMCAAFAGPGGRRGARDTGSRETWGLSRLVTPAVVA